jgi:hypothetical protein
MARIIKLNQIAEFMGDQVDQLVRAMTLEAEGRLKEETPVDTGRLRGNWQTKIEPKLGTISNNLPYAEPVMYGTNLPSSWSGKYRTRQGTKPGFPELIAKDLESYARSEYERIKRKS